MFGNYVSMKMDCVGITQLEERGWGLLFEEQLSFSVSRLVITLL